MIVAAIATNFLASAVNLQPSVFLNNYALLTLRYVADPFLSPFTCPLAQ